MIAASVLPPLLAALCLWLSEEGWSNAVYQVALWVGFLCAGLVGARLLANSSRFPNA